MTEIQSALPLAAGAGGGFQLGEALGNIANFTAGVPAEIAPDVKTAVIWVVVPLAALAAHWFMSIDLDKDGKSDLFPQNLETKP